MSAESVSNFLPVHVITSFVFSKLLEEASVIVGRSAFGTQHKF